VPISALVGDNVVDRSKNMDWYEGPTLMYLLENMHIGSDINRNDFRMPVQYVIRPQSKEYPDYRGYGGRVMSGSLNVGDIVKVLPSGFTSKVKTIDLFTESLEKAIAPQSVTVQLEDDIDISRGDMLVKETNGHEPVVSQDIDVMLCWFNERKMISGGKYTLRQTSAEMRCMIKSIDYKMNINTLEHDPEDLEVNMNDIVRVKLRTTKPLFYDSYYINRNTGSLVLIDETTNETVAAGMIV
jgi:sulfate adenylyltransferase subunit 1